MSHYMDVNSARSERTEVPAYHTGKKTARKRNDKAADPGEQVREETMKQEDPAAVYTKSDIDQEEIETEISLKEEEERREKQYKALIEQYRENNITFLEKLIRQMQESNVQRMKKNKIKKRLDYNYRKVSGTVMRAKSITQAGNALTSANAALSSLLRKNSSGNYNENEIRNAMQHARKMVRTARSKISNLKEETQHEKTDKGNISGQKKKNNSLKKAVAVKKEQEIQQLEKKLKQKREQMKNSHRRGELMELTQADLEYLKRKIDAMRSEQIQLSEASLFGDSFGLEGVPEAAEPSEVQSEEQTETSENSAESATGETTGGTGAAGSFSTTV